jgi:hypothetical protein
MFEQTPIYIVDDENVPERYWGSRKSMMLKFLFAFCSYLPSVK